MPTYIVLTRFTQQGIQALKDSPNRQQAWKETARNLGAEVKVIYGVTGPYDTLAIVEAPDDETLAKVTLGLGTRGNVRTETWRAFTEEEYRRIVGGLP